MSNTADSSDLDMAIGNQAILRGHGAKCQPHHTDQHWLWPTDRCPECRVTHRKWLTAVKDPRTWL